MFFSNKTPQKLVKGAPTVQMDCQNCNNTTNHQLWWIVPGPYMRYMGMQVAGRKHFVYVCPVCKNIAKEISKEQAAALRVGG